MLYLSVYLCPCQPSLKSTCLCAASYNTFSLKSLTNFFWGTHQLHPTSMLHIFSFSMHSLCLYGFILDSDFHPFIHVTLQEQFYLDYIHSDYFTIFLKNSFLFYHYHHLLEHNVNYDNLWSFAFTCTANTNLDLFISSICIIAELTAILGVIQNENYC